MTRPEGPAADGVDADFVDLLADSDNHAVLVIDRPSRIIRACNDAVVRVLGYKPSELIGRSTEILHLDRKHFIEFGEILEREIAAGRPFHRRYGIRHRDGRTIETMYLVVPIIDKSGGVTGSVSIVRDVGGAEANRRLLDLVVNEIPVSVAVTRIADSRILLANRACREMFGLTAGGSRQALDFYADPTDRERLVALLRRDGAVSAFELRMHRSDGSLFWASLSMRLIRFDGAESIFGTVVDVTVEREARETERKTRLLLESIVDNAPAHIYLKDLDSRYLLVNRALRDRLKPFVDDPIGQLSYAHFPPHDAAKFAGQDAEVVRTRSVVQREVDVAAAGETARTFRVTKFPVLDDNGDVTAIGGITIDITAEREARESERRTRSLLESIIDNAPAHIFLKDLDKRYVLVNRPLREARARAGLDPTGGMGYTRHRPGDAAKFARQDAEVIRTRSVLVEEVTIDPIGGHPCTLRVTKFPVLDEQGKIAAIGGISLDVTGERAARENEQRTWRLLEGFLDNAPGHVFLKDPEDRYLLVNRQFRDQVAPILGDPVGQKTHDVYSPEDTAKTKAHDAEVIRTRSAVTREMDLTSPAGVRRPLRITKFPVYDPTGALWAIGVISLDITAERAAREAADRTQRNLLAIVDNAPAEIFLKDREGAFILVNRPLRDERTRLGVDPADRKAHQPPELIERLESQDRKVLEEAATVNDEAVIQTASGPRIKRIVKFPVLDENGEVVAIGGIGIDITAERAARDAEQTARRELEAIVDNAPLHIFLKDRDRRFILINRALREERSRAGVAPTERDSYLGYAPETAARFATLDQAVLDNGAIVAEEITTRVEGRDDARMLRVTKFPVFDEHGAIVAIGGISLDITQQRDLEQRLRHAQKIEAVGQLTGGIAHDFNNLIAVILGNAEILKDDLAADPAKQRMAELIETAAERAAALTERMLAFSRQQELHPSVIDCRNLVGGLMDLMKRTIGENVDVETVLPESGAKIWADRGQLENCLINLVVNARDAMPGGGRIRIEIADVTVGADAAPPAPDLAPGPYVRLSVSDAGTGMPAEVQARAFDPFFTTKEVGKGTGLGLSMVYGFVKQSGGQIAIDSEVDVGTTVVLYLPAIGDDAVAAPVRDPDATPATGSETVLVVEDEPLVRAFVADELRRLGYDVVEAENGGTALEALRGRKDIALLFTDMVMPGGMRGNELARAARAIAPDLKVLFTTGYSSAFDGKPLPGDEFVTVLKKPYPRRELAHYVRRCLDAAS